MSRSSKSSEPEPIVVPTGVDDEWDRAYRTDHTPWHRNTPHPVVVRLVRSGLWRPGRVLDIGCGRAVDLHWLAEQGFEAWGIDGSGEALRQASVPSGRLRLEQMSAFSVEQLPVRFDYVLDLGCYQTRSFQQVARRRAYTEQLARVLRRGGEFLLVCTARDGSTGTRGPRRIGLDEIRSVFGHRFQLAAIQQLEIATALQDSGRWRWVTRWTKSQVDFVPRHQ